MYTAGELSLIRDTIRGVNKFRIADINPELSGKFSTDPNIRQYGIFCFFPKAYEWIYESDTLPSIEYESGHRGKIAILSHPTGRIVIKPLQNSREHEVAAIAAELQTGPLQYQTLDNFLTEEFVEGDFFSQLSGDKASADNMYLLGRRMGEILYKLHSRDIYYNDLMLTDDHSGKSHVIVPQASPAILFDYGVALRLDNFPNLNNEEAFNYARTFPGVNETLEFKLHELNSMLVRKEINEQQARETLDVYKQELVTAFRPHLRGVTKEQIFLRDLDFIDEGVRFAGYRLGSRVPAAFLTGFNENYRRL